MPQTFLRRRVLAAAAACCALLGVGVGVATAAPPDPLAQGPYSTSKLEYDAGSILLTIPAASTGASTAGPGISFEQELEGSIIYPDTPGPWKVVLFMHGRHSTCVYADGRESIFPVGDETECADGSDDGSTRIRNYAGYDYISENLASHGYVVMSVSANSVHTYDQNGLLPIDAGANARAQIIAASLDLLYRWNNGTGPEGVGTKLTGKLEMQRVGIMGHSRGAEAVTEFINFNRLRPSPGRKYALDAVFSLAPIDRNKHAPTGTAYATLLPYCDGDVSTLSGANAFARAKYADPNDPYPKIQFSVQGADHNFYNTVWTNDDGASYSTSATNKDVACGAELPGDIRLFPQDQRKTGEYLISSFLRTYLGKESSFEPYMTGEAGTPASVCPTLNGVPCDDLIMTTYVAPAGERMDVIQPDANEPLTRNATGGPLSEEGLTTWDWCNPDPYTKVDAALPPASQATSVLRSCGPADSYNRSFTRQLRVGWDGPSTVTADLAGDSRDVTKYASLHLAAGVDSTDARNPVSDGTHPSSARQDFDVVLVDGAGHEATAHAGDYGSALKVNLGSFRRHIILNGIRIPMSAFTGVDLSDIESVELRFGGRTAKGAIFLGDVSFEEPASAASSAASAPPPSSGVSLPAPPPASTPGETPKAFAPVPDAIPLDGVTALPAKSACADESAPLTKVARSKAKLSGKRLVISGVSTDAGCVTPSGVHRNGKVKRVQVTVSRKGKGTCRFVDSKGRLTSPAPCGEPVSLIAKGAARWRLAMRASLPPGKYTAQVRAVDRAGNLETSRRATTVRFEVTR